MKNILFSILFSMLAFASFGQGGCDSLYHILNAKHISARTADLVLKQLEENGCVERSEARYRSSNGSYNPNIGINSSNEDDFQFSLEHLQNDIDEIINKKEEIINKYNNGLPGWIEWGYHNAGYYGGGTIGAGLGAVGCSPSVFGSGACGFAGGVVGAEFLGGIGKWQGKLLTTYARNGRDAKLKEYTEKIMYLLDKSGITISEDCRNDNRCLARKIGAAVTTKAQEDMIGETARLVLNNLPTNLATQEDINTLRKDINETLSLLQGDLEADLKNVFGAINILSETMIEYLEITLDFQKDVRKKFDEIEENFDKLHENDENIINTLNLHSQLLAGTIFEVGMTQNMVMGLLDNRQQLNLYEACKNGKGNCPSILKQQMNSSNDSIRLAFFEKAETLKKIDEVQTFMKVANNVSDALILGQDITNMFLNDEDAKNVGRAFYYVQSAIGVSQSVAGLVGQVASGGDIFGASIALLKGVVGLISGNEPKPSPEMQAIMQMREEMHERFDIIDEKLDTIISLQVQMHTDLTRNIQANREFMDYRFNNVDYNLGGLSDGQRNIRSELSLLNQSVNGLFPCRQILENIALNDNPIGFEVYQDYIDIYGNYQNCDECLLNLETLLESTLFSNGDINFSLFKVSGFENEYISKEKNNFHKLVTFFKWYYGSIGDNLYTATQTLLFPTNYIDANQYVYGDLYDDDFDLGLIPSEVLNGLNYIDSYGLREFIEIYAILYPYFEFRESEQGSFKPMPLDDYINFTSETPDTDELNAPQSRKQKVEAHIRLLRKVNEMAIAQQALMSGDMVLAPFYSILFQEQMNGDTLNPVQIEFNGASYPIRQFVTDIINNNPTLAQNFASYVIRKNYEFGAYVHRDSFEVNKESYIEDFDTKYRYQAFYQFAYNNLPSWVWNIIGVGENYTETLEFHPSTLTSVNTVELENLAVYNALDFEQFDDFDNAFLHIDAAVTGIKCEAINNDFLSCEAFIPVPEMGVLESNQFSFTEAYQVANATEVMIENIEFDVFLPDGLDNNWLPIAQYKLMFLTD